jgi:hypothetical protein
VLRIRIRDPGWVKNQDPDPGCNDPDHISESLETNFWVTILKFLMRIRDEKNSDPGSWMEKIWIVDPGWKKFGSWILDGKNFDTGSGINLPDPQHCRYLPYAFVPDSGDVEVTWAPGGWRRTEPTTTVREAPPCGLMSSSLALLTSTRPPPARQHGDIKILKF